MPVPERVLPEPDYRPRGFDVQQYALDFSLEEHHRPGAILAGSATITIQVTDPGGIDAVDLDFVGFDIQAVTVDGQPAEWERGSNLEGAEEDVFRVVAPGLSAGTEHAVNIRYRGRPTIRRHAFEEDFLVGFLGFGEDAELEALRWTQSQPTGARLWFPCVDHPSDKAPLRIRFEVPAPLVVASNGVLENGGPELYVREGVQYRRYTWVEDHPIATYLAAVTVGELEVDRYVVDGVPIENYFPTTIDGTFVRQKSIYLENAMPILQDLFGPYPFEKYGHVLVTDPTVIIGMEHQTLSLLDARLFTEYPAEDLEDVIVHELIHQWLGNLVTPADHNSYWFSEGMATFGTWWYAERMNYGFSRLFKIVRKRYEGKMAYWRFWQDDLALTHLPERARLGVPVYNKGHSVFAMLREEIGEEAFILGLQNILRDFQFQNVSGLEIEAAMEQASGTELDWFFDQWIYAKGMLLLRYDCATQKVDISDKFQLDCTFEQVQDDHRRLQELWETEVGGGVVPDPFPLYRVTIPMFVVYTPPPAASTDFELLHVPLEPKRVQTVSYCFDKFPERVNVDPYLLTHGLHFRGVEVQEVPFKCFD